MRIFLALMMSLLMCASAYSAQHTFGDVYVVNNVGIGTSAPATTLEVNGTAKMTGFKLTTSPTAGYVLTSDSVGIGTWQPATGGSSQWTTDGDDIYYADGNVAIGGTETTGVFDVIATPSSTYLSNFLTGGTASASNYATSGEPAKAVDGSTSTAWYDYASGGGSGTFPKWWQYDLGSGVTKIARRLRVYTREWSASQTGFKAFTLSGSNNGTDFTELLSTTAANTLGGWQEFTFANSTGYRYYRITVTSCYYAGYNVADIPEAQLNELSDNASSLFVASSGNVGIGTTVPQSMLSVGTTGQFKVSSTGVVTQAGGSSGKTTCWKTATTIGYCSSVVAADGTCTCN